MIYSSEHQVIVIDISKNEIKWGFDFIPKITSNTKPDQEKNKVNVYFNSKTESFRKAELFIEVINDLQFQRLIILHKHPDKEINLNFILKEPQQEERPFKEFHDFFNDYLNFEIEPQSVRLAKFKNRDYLDELIFWKRRSYKTNYYMAFCIIILSLITATASIIYNQKILNKTQDIIINSQTKIDSLEITSPEIRKVLSKIDSSLQDIKIQVQHISSKKQESVFPELK